MRDQSVHLEGNWFPRWKMKEVNWEHYSMVASGKLMEIMSHSGDDVEELNSMITGILYESAEEIYRDEEKENGSMVVRGVQRSS